jgi:hypothetical protein
MSFFGIQVGLLQVALQNADTCVSHQFCQGENTCAVPEHGECKGPPGIVQGGFFHAGCLRPAGKNSPHPVITQTLGTEARVRHPQSGAVVLAMIQII